MAAILPRKMVLEPKAVRSVDFDPPAEWVSLREWDLFGAGYGRTADVVTNHLVLHYPQSEWAELDAAVMSRPPTPHSRHCSLPRFAARSSAGMSTSFSASLIARNLVVSGREMRMRGVRPDFPSEVPLIEDVVRGMVEAPVLRAAWAGSVPQHYSCRICFNWFLFDYSCKANHKHGLYACFPIKCTVGC